ncbi:circularly permuted type 2 ATP-grasp protein [Corynebacterium sp. ED61]|uniref:circularly permuted type 2 ATP-grasp protein n=1 Tax=Corynebacterium sp. ED61 TaxID=2211360 RepID=UPI001884728B|nr:circularly permuted type 2 ATP-grasp protein [Corynebacterium sp. ED61]MBF0581400.1 circularly permuted type 2 ATP-grasp protein [Corynebacterium sp. ED61]
MCPAKDDTNTSDGTPREQSNDAPSPLVTMEFSDETLPTYDPDADATPSEDAQLFSAYDPNSPAAKLWDEALFADGTPRPRYAFAMEKFAEIGLQELDERNARAEDLEREEGITFRVTGENEPQVFPMDFIPRIINAETWTFLSEGLEQRARALNAFLDDVYGPKKIVEAGVVDEFDLQRAPGYEDSGFLQPTGSVRAQVCGMDLVCTDEGRWYVLEDNLRVPSGITFSHSMRKISRELFGEVMEGYDMHDPEEAFPMIRETMRASVPQNAKNPQDPQLAVVSIGDTDSAWFEHQRIAEMIGAPVCTPDQLAVIDGYLHYRDAEGQERPLDVVYIRITKEQLFEATGFNGEKLGPGLEQALNGHRVLFANAFGNGVGDDKAIYAYVPQMIRFYLDEEPLLDQVPTCLCHKPGEVDAVLSRLGEVVVKPVDGYGGNGITIGPECSDEVLAQRAEELKDNPEGYIAQDVVRLSTLPTYGEDTTGNKVIHPRHVDLRAFVHVRPAQSEQEASDQPVNAHRLTAHTVPAGLTRTAAAGSLIVNTSRGGGGKDTWILQNPVEWGENIPSAGALVDEDEEGPVVMQ